MTLLFWFILVAAGCAASPPAVLRVATLNVAHGRGAARSQIGLPRHRFETNLDAIATLLCRVQPDVVALQEVDAPSSWSGSFDHLERLAAASGYPHRFHGRHAAAALGPAKLNYGTALVSRHPMTATASHRFDAKLTPSKGFVTAQIQFDDRPILIASTHLEPGSRRIRRRQADELITALAGAGLPLIVLGDFNCDWPDDDALRRIATHLALQAFEPDGDALRTWPSSDPDKRIDWIICSRDLRFVTYEVWPDVVSDHLGVVAELRWNGRRNPEGVPGG